MRKDLNILNAYLILFENFLKFKLKLMFKFIQSPVNQKLFF